MNQLAQIAQYNKIYSIGVLPKIDGKYFTKKSIAPKEKLQTTQKQWTAKKKNLDISQAKDRLTYELKKIELNTKYCPKEKNRQTNVNFRTSAREQQPKKHSQEQLHILELNSFAKFNKSTDSKRHRFSSTRNRQHTMPQSDGIKYVADLSKLYTTRQQNFMIPNIKMATFTNQRSIKIKMQNLSCQEILTSERQEISPKRSIEVNFNKPLTIRNQRLKRRNLSIRRDRDTRLNNSYQFNFKTSTRNFKTCTRFQTEISMIGQPKKLSQQLQDQQSTRIQQQGILILQNKEIAKSDLIR